MTLREQSPAERAGCCLASSKETCVRPPCPCNMQSWRPEEHHALAVAARFAAREAQR